MEDNFLDSVVTTYQKLFEGIDIPLLNFSTKDDSVASSFGYNLKSNLYRKFNTIIDVDEYLPVAKEVIEDYYTNRYKEWATKRNGVIVHYKKDDCLKHVLEYNERRNKEIEKYNKEVIEKLKIKKVDKKELEKVIKRDLYKCSPIDAKDYRKYILENYSCNLYTEDFLYILEHLEKGIDEGQLWCSFHGKRVGKYWYFTQENSTLSGGVYGHSLRNTTIYLLESLGYTIVFQSSGDIFELHVQPFKPLEELTKKQNGNSKEK